MEEAGRGEISYRKYRDGDEQAIVDLFNLVFHRSITVKDWSWTYRENPIRRKDIVLALSGPRLVGQAASVPLEFTWKGRAIQVARPQNVMVHPDFQNRGIFTELLRRLTVSFSGEQVDLVVTFPNNNSLPAFIRKLDYTHVADIPTWTLPAGDPGEGKTGTSAQCTIAEVPTFSPADRNFIGSCLSGYDAFNARSPGYLGWRYGRDSGKVYHVLRAYDGDQLAGLLVFKLYRENQSVDLVDIFCGEGVESVRPWLEAIAGWFHGRGTVISGFSTWMMPHYRWHPLFEEAGFRRSGFPTHLVCRSFSPGTVSGSLDSTTYYLTMGDSDVY
jgi:GNAT superfamily N-acetyltransferase